MSSSSGKTSGRAIVSLVLSLASPALWSLFLAGLLNLFASLASLLWPFLFSLAGAVVGHSALRRIKKTGQSGRGIALAGVILGWVVFILPLVYLVAIPLSWFLTPGW
jgi:predicted PurR-regulated permease PerM